MTGLRSVLACALVAAVFPASAWAAPGRIAVGLSPDLPHAEAAAVLAGATGGVLVEDMGPLDALVFDVPEVEPALAAARGVSGVAYAEELGSTRTLAFRPNDPLAERQWYLSAIRAFDRWAEVPPHPPILVAVIDSGIDGGHPEFAGRIAAAKSFTGSPARADRFGHGTMIAGEIAAALGNAEGIAGVGIPVRLLVAKVVASDGRISLLAEARAIRWAVNRGAKVINLSLGGPRDPDDPRRDTYSALEHAAVDYATRRGAVVVAAAGNCLAASCPERHASWPAALPHVIGVSSTASDGTTPLFSNRDPVFNDLAAPGLDILTTYPRAQSKPGCEQPGYTLCANRESRRSPRGTSFSAPLVSAAAALLAGERGLLGLRSLHASQIRTLLESSAVDLGSPGRDARTGNGLLNVHAALAKLDGDLPPRDRYETNDDAGSRAFGLRGASRTIEATLDRYDDVRDVYRVWLNAGQRAEFALAGPQGGESDLALWKPGTKGVTGAQRNRRNRVALSAGPGAHERIVLRVRRTGSYFLETRLPSGASGAYTLTIRKTRAG